MEHPEVNPSQSYLDFCNSSQSSSNLMENSNSSFADPKFISIKLSDSQAVFSDRELFQNQGGYQLGMDNVDAQTGTNLSRTDKIEFEIDHPNTSTNSNNDGNSNNDSTISGASGKLARVVSRVWKFYRIASHEDKRVECLICHRILSHKYHSTKGMWNHLSLHPEQFEEIKGSSSSATGSIRIRKRKAIDLEKLKKKQPTLNLDEIYGTDVKSESSSSPSHGQAPIIQTSRIVKLSRTETFSAAHCLRNPHLSEAANQRIYDKCSNPNGHGHNYRWTVVLKGPVDECTGMVYNLADLKAEMNEVLKQVDHKNLDKDVSYFRDNGIVSTTENLTIFLFNELVMKMKNSQLLKKVVVQETDKNEFSYSGPWNGTK